jgi:phage terminase large subunit GpA-like protein
MWPSEQNWDGWGNPPPEPPWDVSRPLSDWIESHVVLPVGRVQDAGPIKLHSYQNGIADAIGDESIERISLIKSVRTGFTTLLNACVAYYAKEKPCNILVVVPTNSDSRDYIVSELEPMFESSPKLRNVLPMIKNTVTNRATMLYRPFPGGSLRIVSARSPRNLRRHSSRVILCDEVDAFTVFGGGISKSEGDSIALAERRSLSFSPRKLISGSTPLETDTSIILRLYGRSDQRIFEIPCISCHAYFELMWKDIHWERDDPETAHAVCPCCGTLIAETHKTAMVEAGRWRVTCPEVKNHAGFRLNALISPMKNASWNVLVQEFIHCRHKPDLLKVFTTTLLGQSWDSIQGSEFDEDLLSARAEEFSLAAIPKEVISLTCCQLAIAVANKRFPRNLPSDCPNGAPG